MATSLAVAEFEQHLGEVMARVEGGEEVLVSRDGKPAFRLVPVVRPTPSEPRIPGRNILGITYIAEDFDAPMTDEELAEWGL